MLRTLTKALAVVLGALVAAAAALYVAGARVVLDGGGTPAVRFIGSAQERERALEEHRAAQRAAAPAPMATPAAAPIQPAGDAAAPGAPAPGAQATAARSHPSYWTDFRGPGREGHYRQQPILTSWPSGGLTPVWKQPIGAGHASFVVARGRAFTIEQRGEDEVVAAYDVATGREVWTNRWGARFREMRGGDGPRATPVWDGGHVYALGATGELRAIDEMEGRTLWRTNILDDAGAANLEWGMAAAPLVVDGTLVVLAGGRDGRSVAAYDRRTGRRLWSALDDQQSYSSPMLATLGGVRQVLMFSAARLAGLTPDGGEVLWEYPWRTSYDVNASQPIVIGDNRVFVSTGYGTGAAVIELAREGGQFGVRELWRNIRMKNQFTSSVLHDGFVYGLDESILACVDAATGELKWKGGRYGYGQILLASGHIIVLTENGELALVRATPERHLERARFPAIEGRTWNHMALDDGYLLVRNGAEMAAFDLNPTPRRASGADDGPRLLSRP